MKQSAAEGSNLHIAVVAPKQASDAKIGKKRARLSARLFCAAALCALEAGRSYAAGEQEIVCVNPYSGASWKIKVNYDRATVDDNPARISDSEIAWRDARDGWNYRLNRRTGDLTVTLASATGGNFLYDRCQADH